MIVAQDCGPATRLGGYSTPVQVARRRRRRHVPNLAPTESPRSVPSPSPRPGARDRRCGAPSGTRASRSRASAQGPRRNRDRPEQAWRETHAVAHALPVAARASYPVGRVALARTGRDGATLALGDALGALRRGTIRACLVERRALPSLRAGKPAAEPAIAEDLLSGRTIAAAASCRSPKDWPPMRCDRQFQPARRGVHSRTR